MPRRFRVPMDQWPVYTILDACGRFGKRRFLVDWEANPLTGSIFTPSWVRYRDSYFLIHESDQ
jgi:hypothetical protein